MSHSPPPAAAAVWNYTPPWFLGVENGAVVQFASLSARFVRPAQSFGYLGAQWARGRVLVQPRYVGLAREKGPIADGQEAPFGGGDS